MTLVTEGMEPMEHYVIGLDYSNPLVVRFMRSQCYAFKKLHPEQRQSKAMREMVRVVKKLKCHDANVVVVP